MGTDAHRVTAAALAVAAAGLGSAACLIVFFAAGGGPFGLVNDVGNAALGVLSAWLAWVSWPSSASGRGWPALAAVAVGAATMVTGSVLVVLDVTGYYLAGLVSGFGAALIGVWLIVFARAGGLPARLAGFGLAAGVVLLLGLLVAPGILAGVDDQRQAPWYVVLGQVNWVATYLFYPVWCVLFAAHARHGSR
ncbi:hypothetical protein R8Z50_12625 [Longispora sp. K20-0274]|uniref:hypothetical protein n=1 Tax=Longispora sp. K20-0274 TaxID=3088255 RepID=UPI00399B27A3